MQVIYGNLMQVIASPNVFVFVSRKKKYASLSFAPTDARIEHSKLRLVSPPKQ